RARAGRLRDGGDPDQFALGFERPLRPRRQGARPRRHYRRDLPDGLLHQRLDDPRDVRRARRGGGSGALEHDPIKRKPLPPGLAVFAVFTAGDQPDPPNLTFGKRSTGFLNVPYLFSSVNKRREALNSFAAGENDGNIVRNAHARTGLGVSPPRGGFDGHQGPVSEGAG